MALIEAASLGKTYTNGAKTLTVLRDVSLAVECGEFVAIVGPSGAGKSTLLHLLGWLDQPSAGDIRFDGVSFRAASERQRAQVRNRRIGFVFQFYHLLPELTARENVMLPALIRRDEGRGTRDVRRRADELLAFVGLGDRLAHRPNQLSGGEQQRVVIARALFNDPDVVLCDEPTGNLDSATGARIVELLQRLQRQQRKTVVLVTHEAALAASADRIVRLRDGIIVQ